ncbi:hypothetical protein HGM15179_000560 [Zosterops borbonicus]|uniref:Uncharacterized protein n=1 Tax=Zosterops borbonicus TaxID=364589 RepID=A0A8K1GW65_9PASS|nr:hypothetical protein HGM15179_000560 [Zosterops borbonicus]
MLHQEKRTRKVHLKETDERNGNSKKWGTEADKVLTESKLDGIDPMKNASHEKWTSSLLLKGADSEYKKTDMTLCQQKDEEMLHQEKRTRKVHLKETDERNGNSKKWGTEADKVLTESKLDGIDPMKNASHEKWTSSLLLKGADSELPILPFSPPPKKPPPQTTMLKPPISERIAIPEL